MPIYEYRCKACGHQLEKLQKISDDPLSDCPACGQPELSKLISAAGFRLKGGGWYETDFKKDKKRNLAGDTDSKSDGGKSEGGKSEGSKSEGGKTDSSKSDSGKSDSKPASGKAA